MLRFHKDYFLITVLLLLTEILIAAYVRDKFIRPYIGDLLVVILIYCFFKSFLRIRTIKLAVGVLLFSFIVEALQYLNLLEAIGLQNHKIAKIVLGNSFSWEDMIAYTAGFGLILLAEFAIKKSKSLPVTGRN